MQADGDKSFRELEMSKARSQLCVLRKSHPRQAEHSQQMEKLQEQLKLLQHVIPGPVQRA